MTDLPNGELGGLELDLGVRKEHQLGRSPGPGVSAKAEEAGRLSS